MTQWVFFSIDECVIKEKFGPDNNSSIIILLFCPHLWRGALQFKCRYHWQEWQLIKKVTYIDAEASSSDFNLWHHFQRWSSHWNRCNWNQPHNLTNERCTFLNFFANIITCYLTKCYMIFLLNTRAERYNLPAISVKT